jgi:4-amino-4-deoxy-L-arabinose transferase-like glycosyltransferase
VTREARAVRPPISIPLLFAPVFVCVYVLHFTLLRLPYFWDEGGYYIPAAWDFYRLGTLIPETTMRNAHPPLPSILLAAWWKLTGFHILSTRLFMCLVTTAALLAVFRLARMLLDDAAGLTVMALTAIYPVWFAQSTLAHADMFAAAFTLWAVGVYADRTEWTGKPAANATGNAINAGLLFALAALAKETAIVIPAALFLFELWNWVPHVSRLRNGFSGMFTSSCISTPDATKEPRPRIETWSTRHITWLAALAFPALPLFGWYLYHRAKTGFMFGNPEFLRYNATANLSPLRVLLSLRHRLVHLTIHMNLFVPVLATLAVLLLPSAENKPFLRRSAVRLLLFLLITQWIAFSVLGGALLTRYLLPAYPLVLILCVAVWKSRVRWWPAIAALSLLGFAIGCEVNPPYPFAPEDNLAYRDMIVLHQHAIREMQRRYPGATVLTAWPVAADLQKPELGYVKTPMQTVEIQNFTAEEVAKAAANAGAYDTALVFSTKYDPPPGGLSLGSDRSGFYDNYRDLRPAEIARALGGTVVWQEERKGQWAAVLAFPRGYDVRWIAPMMHHRNGS